ncbi:MAG TPA: IPT/TIG domain-containing protein [Candidatus Obscuribacterales bacterium]
MTSKFAGKPELTFRGITSLPFVLSVLLTLALAMPSALGQAGAGRTASRTARQLAAKPAPEGKAQPAPSAKEGEPARAADKKEKEKAKEMPPGQEKEAAPGGQSAAGGSYSGQEKGSDKPRKGLFGLGKSKPRAREEREKSVPAQPVSSQDKAEQQPGKPATEATEQAQQPSASAAGGKTEVPTLEEEEEAIEPLLPDPGLISLLKDISKALKDPEEAAKLADPCQKAALAVGAAALAKAVENPDLLSNRIISYADKEKFQSAMTTEAWSSGDIPVSANCHASLSAVWAKKVDGLVNVAVAGNCHCQSAPEGHKVGEFVLVLNGKSAVDTGFDIQSQSDVNFWLGKLTSLAVDTSCCPDQQVPTKDAGLDKKSQRSVLVLKAVLTERSRKHVAAVEALRERRRLLSMKLEEERLKKQEEEQARAKAEAEAKVKAEAEAKGKAEKEQSAKPEEEQSGKVQKTAANTVGEAAPKESAADPAAAAGRSGTASGAGPAGQPAPEPARVPPGPVIEDPRTGQSKAVAPLAGAPYGAGHGQGYEQRLPDVAVAMPGEQPQPARGASGWDSPPPPPAANPPSSAAVVMVPERAIAGQFLTAAVVNQKHAGEPSVELSFNGAALATGQDGKALFLVPEDAIPGPTLHVSLVARPESPPVPIHVLQPLMMPTTPQIPRIDRVSQIVPGGGTIVIEGHHFDGVANRNSVIVDGMWDARVLVSSPVQLKADLPANLLPGPHTVTVSTVGLRSNPGQFEVVVAEVQPLVKETAKDTVKKLVVKASGTRSPVRLRVKNYTPEVLKISKGNDITVVTPGGPNNTVVLDVQRLRPGAFYVEATME